MQKKENNIIRLIGLGPLIFIPLFVIVIIALIVFEHEKNFKHTLTKIEKNLILAEKKAIKSKVDGIADLVMYQNDIMVDKLQIRVKERVITAHKIASKLYEQYKNQKSSEEIQRLIRTTLRPLLWNSGESFIFILNFDGIFQLAPKYLEHLEGRSILNFQDATGRYVIKEEIDIVKKKNEGFLWDSFTRPSDPTKKYYKQVVFVKKFGHYNWYMGSGEYLDNAKKITDTELINSIKKVSKDSTNYVFLSHLDGRILLNPTTPKYINKNYNTILDENLKNSYEKFHTILMKQNSAYISYKWKNPTTHDIEKKYSYVKKIDNTEWFIGTGFYESTIKNQAAKQGLKLYEDYHLKINYILTIGCISILVSLVFSYLISQYLKRTFTRYQININKKTVELEALNRTLEEKVEQRTIELEKSKASLEILATTDNLTRVHNRYSVMNILEKEMNRAQRHEEHLCIMLFDIDHFKNVNDTYGHDVGDRVLQSITEVVQESLREIDIIGRYGGEEFLVLFPNTSFEDGQVVCERIRTNVEAFEFEHGNDLTISMGLVVFMENETSDTLFKRLDELLYKAKHNGRNTLCY